MVKLRRWAVNAYIPDEDRRPLPAANGGTFWRFAKASGRCLQLNIEEEQWARRYSTGATKLAWKVERQ